MFELLLILQPGGRKRLRWQRLSHISGPFLTVGSCRTPGLGLSKANCGYKFHAPGGVVVLACPLIRQVKKQGQVDRQCGAALDNYIVGWPCLT